MGVGPQEKRDCGTIEWGVFQVCALLFVIYWLPNPSVPVMSNHWMVGILKACLCGGRLVYVVGALMTGLTGPSGFPLGPPDMGVTATEKYPVVTGWICTLSLAPLP